MEHPPHQDVDKVTPMFIGVLCHRCRCQNSQVMVFKLPSANILNKFLNNNKFKNLNILLAGLEPAASV